MMRIRANLRILVWLLAAHTGAADASPARPGFDTQTERANGLQTITFGTPAGLIKIHLPDDLRPGDTFSGTISVAPQGKSQEERAANGSALASYSIDLNQQPWPVNLPTQTWTLPATPLPGNSSLVLKDAKGEEAVRTQLSVATRTVRTARAFRLPEIGQTGRLIEAAGPFDGDFATTDLTMEGERLWLVAESPRKLIARSPATKMGMVLLALRERDRAAESDFRNIGVNLAAPKTALTKGETTILTVKVLGLGDLTKAVSLVLENSSTDVISVSDGDRQSLRIEPSVLTDGVHVFERTVTGIKRGSWSITCSVVKDE